MTGFRPELEIIRLTKKLEQTKRLLKDVEGAAALLNANLAGTISDLGDLSTAVGSKADAATVDALSDALDAVALSTAELSDVVGYGGILEGVYQYPIGVNTASYIGGTAIVANRLYLCRFRAPRVAKISSAKFFNGPNSVLAGTNAKIVVYTPKNTGWPDAKVYTSSAQALSNSNTTYTVSGINIAVPEGEVWAGLVFDSAIAAGSNLSALAARHGNPSTNPISGSTGYVDGITFDDSYASPSASIGSASKTYFNGTSMPMIFLEWAPQ